MILSKKTHFILSLYFGTFGLKSFQDFQNTCNIGGLILYVGKFQTLESGTFLRLPRRATGRS